MPTKRSVGCYLSKSVLIFCFHSTSCLRHVQHFPLHKEKREKDGTANATCDRSSKPNEPRLQRYFQSSFLLHLQGSSYLHVPLRPLDRKIKSAQMKSRPNSQTRRSSLYGGGWFHLNLHGGKAQSAGSRLLERRIWRNVPWNDTPRSPGVVSEVFVSRKDLSMAIPDVRSLTSTSSQGRQISTEKKKKQKATAVVGK